MIRVNECKIYFAPINKIVIAELIQGSKAERGISVIEDFVEAFRVVDQKENTWVKEGKLSFKLKRKGKNINLTNCYIAIIAQEYECRIFTLDEHFRDIQMSPDISLI